jgi:hypothetical protein
MKLIFLYVTTALMVAVNVFSQSQDSIQIRGNFREDVCSSSLIFTFSENFTPLVETVIVNNSFVSRFQLLLRQVFIVYNTIRIVEDNL